MSDRKKITIRHATLEDAAKMLELNAQLGYAADTSVINARLAKILKHKDQFIIVAVSEGQEIVGWLQGHSSDSLADGFKAEIVGLVVAESHRRQGVARQLVESAEKWAMELGAETLVVRSNTQRVESHLFYPALGFSLLKTQAVYQKCL